MANDDDNMRCNVDGISYINIKLTTIKFDLFCFSKVSFHPHSIMSPLLIERVKNTFVWTKTQLILAFYKS